MFYCDVKYSDIFRESSHVCCYLLQNVVPSSFSLDSRTQNVLLFSYKNYLIKEVWPPSNSLFNIHNPIIQKLIRWLRRDLSHLNELRFTYNFEKCLGHFSQMFNFYTPWKCQETIGFLTFSGDKEQIGNNNKWDIGLKWIESAVHF